MESCPTCKLNSKRNNNTNQDLTNTRLAAKNQYYSQQSKRVLIIADKRFQVQTDEHKIFRKMWYCDICEKEMKVITESSQIKSRSRKKIEVISRININPTDITNTNLNPDFDQVACCLDNGAHKGLLTQLRALECFWMT